MKNIKRIFVLTAILSMFIGMTIVAEAKTPLAVLGTDYIVTYQKAEFFQDSATKTDYNAIVEVQNISSGNLYLADAQFDFYLNGIIVASESFISSDPRVIAPNEKGYFYTNLGSDINMPYAQYDFIPTLTIKKSTLPVERHIISNISLKETEYGYVDVVGTITNTSSQDQPMTWISIVFYDANGYPFCCAGVNVMNMPAGTTIGFETQPYCRKNFKLSDIASYQIISAPIQYQF